jgi:hypothetical protein
MQEIIDLLQEHCVLSVLAGKVNLIKSIDPYPLTHVDHQDIVRFRHGCATGTTNRFFNASFQIGTE